MAIQTKGDDYLVSYEQELATVLCTGLLDLRGKEGYADLSLLLDEVVKANHSLTTLDLRKLEFLNSSGITTIGGFLIKMRDGGNKALRVLCSDRFTWQSRSMQGLKRLLPEMSIEFE